ncbi:MAG TPA: MerR family transcriptional regulator [Rhodoglobus sp.]|nr:MerR family transcriptional regulator [Rhodoglobus sp.]
MNSGELARLAGVTVRALRHYHQVGVLDEPPRSANGYRRYDVHHLIRVLRIKRLGELGIALERMPALLAAPDDGAEALDSLDAELAAQIERLTRQRQTIARLRAEGSAPDLPPDLARFLTDDYGSPTLARIDREITVLLAHLAAPEAVERLAGVYAALYEQQAMPALQQFGARFEALDAEAGQAEIDALVDDFVRILLPLIPHLVDEDGPDLSAAAHLIDEYQRGMLNPAQQRALDTLEQRLAT